MYRVMKVDIHPSEPLYEWCDTITKKANSLDNVILFYMRQALTAVEKEPDKLTSNEAEAMQNILGAAKKYGLKPPVKGQAFLSYKLLLNMFQDTHNPDYFAKGLPRQSAQWAIKRVIKRMKGFFASLREYKTNPGKFTGKPNLPHYHKSGGNATATLTNEDCVILQDKDSRRYMAKLPLTKIRCAIGTPTGKLKQAEVVPMYGHFRLVFVFDDGLPAPVEETDEKECAPTYKEPKRIAAMDMGVNNLAAITCNTGELGLLVKGGAVKSLNQWYNKRTAAIRSAQTKGSKRKFVPTAESFALDYDREKRMNDAMHKVAARIIDWLVEHEMDTFVCGYTRGWKDGCDIGHVNNQNFIQIPHCKLMSILKYRCMRICIRFVEQEESFSSQASYPDGDYIPALGEEGDFHFSGRRRPTRYKGMYKKGGFRGLYVTADGTIINSDLNGSANIGRKAFPELYTNVSFDRPTIIKHPDLEREHLTAGRVGPVSKSKQTRLKSRRRKRLAERQRMDQIRKEEQSKLTEIVNQAKISIPIRVELCE